MFSFLLYLILSEFKNSTVDDISLKLTQPAGFIFVASVLDAHSVLYELKQGGFKSATQPCISPNHRNTQMKVHEANRTEIPGTFFATPRKPRRQHIMGSIN
jgi:hypothetical protein